MSKQLDWPYVINLGNSIIGVSVLAMPFCFKQCGILLGVLLLISSAWLTTLTCDLLIKGAHAAKKRSYEFLALHVFGPGGKFAVELCIIGLLLGSCVAFHVVIGDLGPAIISRMLGIENTSNLRMCLMMFLGMFVALPLGMLKNVESLANISAISLAFYMIFVTEVFTAAFPNLWSGVWISKVKIWEPSGIFKCLPIFSLAYGCQSQLFIMYDALPEPSLKRMNKISRSAVSLCTLVYLSVGYFGYVAFCDEDVSGDILMNFRPTFFAEAIKLGFVLSVAVSFPLVIFPCRAALHTLLCTKAEDHMQVTGTHDNFGGAPLIPDLHFKLITVSIVVGTLITGICIPNIEFVLAITGATTGSLICYIFPAILFLHVLSMSGSPGKMTAQFILFVGVTILLASTYTTLYSNQDNQAVDPKVKIAPPPDVKPAPVGDVKPVEAVNKMANEKDKVAAKGGEGIDPGGGGGADGDKAKKAADVLAPAGKVVADGDKRQEPPNPHAPDDAANVKDAAGEDTKDDKDLKKDTLVKTTAKPKVEKEVTPKKEGSEKAAEVKEKELKKKEEELDIKLKDADAAKKAAESEAKQLLNELEIQRQEQKQLIEKQKEIIQELKQHQQDAHKGAPAVEVKQPEQLAKDIVEDKEQIKQQQAQQILQGDAANVQQQAGLQADGQQVGGQVAGQQQAVGDTQQQPQIVQQPAAAVQQGNVGNQVMQGNMAGQGVEAGGAQNVGQVKGDVGSPPVVAQQAQGAPVKVAADNVRQPGGVPQQVQPGLQPQAAGQQPPGVVQQQQDVVRQPVQQPVVPQQQQQMQQQQGPGQQQGVQQQQAAAAEQQARGQVVPNKQIQKRSLDDPQVPVVRDAAPNLNVDAAKVGAGLEGGKLDTQNSPRAQDVAVENRRAEQVKQQNINPKNAAVRNPVQSNAAIGDRNVGGGGANVQGNIANENKVAINDGLGEHQQGRAVEEMDPWQESKNDQFLFENAEKLQKLAPQQKNMEKVIRENVHNAARISRKR